MAWVLESTLQAISRFQRERSLTLEERMMLLMQHDALWRPRSIFCGIRMNAGSWKTKT